jgi:hypothetical protein
MLGETGWEELLGEGGLALLYLVLQTVRHSVECVV